jgi:hypothetical protein
MARTMTLAGWAAKKGRGAVSQLSRASGLAYSTVLYALEGRPLRYDTAVKLSKATGGAVRVKDIPLIGDEAAA